MMWRKNCCRTSLAVFVLSAVAALPAAGQVIYEDFKVIADDGASSDRFGASVGVSGTTVVVGAWGNDDAGFWSGSAYLFDINTGQQLFKLVAEDATIRGYFGWSVGISGTTAIIGAYRDDEGGVNSGSAYLFDTTTGQQLFKLRASDGAPNDRFGVSVAIADTTGIVGSHFHDGVGAAYLFDTTTGQQLLELMAIDSATNDRFGSSVAIFGTTAIVGAPGNDGAGYIFDTTTGQQLLKLVAPDDAVSASFGDSVAIFGTKAIVMGSELEDGSPISLGVGYLFDTITGQLLHVFTGPYDPLLATSVAMSDRTAIIGASNSFGFGVGSAYLFDTASGEQVARVYVSDPGAGDEFGTSVAISGAAVLVGARGDDDAGSLSGSSYVFSLCLADLNNDGSLNFFDVNAFLEAFAASDPIADFTGNGQFDFFDVSAFLTAFLAGCP